MLNIRPYKESDSQVCGILIAQTYRDYNLAFVAPDQLPDYLGPFAFAESNEKEHKKAIAQIIRAPMVFVTENSQGAVTGIIRGRNERLMSLFVRGELHHQGIGRQLVARFEQECLALDGKAIRLASTLMAVPFYQKLGYTKINWCA